MAMMGRAASARSDARMASAAADHTDSRLPVQGPLRFDTDGSQGLDRALTKLPVIIHYQHIPIRQDHILFLNLCLFHIQNNRKLGSLHPGAILAGKGFKHFLLKFR